MKVSIAIMAHRRREHLVDDLVEQLPGAAVVWDERGDRWDTGRRSMLAHAPRGDWHLVVQDDAVLCRDFLAGAEAALEHVSDHPVSFYTGRTRPHRDIVGDALRRARRQHKVFLAMRGPLWGVAVAVPTRLIKPMLAACEQGRHDNYDLRMERSFFTANGIECWYTIPSLANHRVGQKNPSLVAGRGAAAGRTAYRWIGERSPLEIDWSRGALRVALAVGSKEGAMSLVQAPRKRSKKMAQKRIADRRIYGRDSRGRRVLIAAQGQPIPDGYVVEDTPQERPVRKRAAKPKAAAQRRAKK